jgi:hypothetical protein
MANHWLLLRQCCGPKWLLAMQGRHLQLQNKQQHGQHFETRITF